MAGNVKDIQRLTASVVIHPNGAVNGNVSASVMYRLRVHLGLTVESLYLFYFYRKIKSNQHEDTDLYIYLQK